jgi:hypothetical protein
VQRSTIPPEHCYTNSDQPASRKLCRRLPVIHHHEHEVRRAAKFLLQAREGSILFAIASPSVRCAALSLRHGRQPAQLTHRSTHPSSAEHTPVWVAPLQVKEQRRLALPRRAASQDGNLSTSPTRSSLLRSNLPDRAAHLVAPSRHLTIEHQSTVPAARLYAFDVGSMMSVFGSQSALASTMAQHA